MANDAKQVDFFVIGGGSGGVRAARIASTHGAKVAVAEESRYGGTCVIRGCVPKKFFVYASHFSHYIDEGKGYGWNMQGEFDWKTLVANKDARIDRLNGIYISMLEKAGACVLNGRAILKSANEVEVDGEVYQCKNILIATGGRPMVPDIPGAEHAITSNEAFHLETLPKRITIVGAGYIGAEFSSIFHGLGVEVTLVHHRKEALRGFDDDIRHQVTENLRNAGVKLLFETEVASISKRSDGGLSYRCLNDSEHETDAVMFATGRRPYTQDLGLEAAGVNVGPRGGIIIDEFGKTSAEGIYAVGDCTDRLQLTPVAIREGHTVADNLFSSLNEQRSLEHASVPTAIFTQPPAATVGLSEADARAAFKVEIYRSHFTPLYHSMTGSEEKVLIKMIVDRGSRRVLGIHMVGADAPEIMQAAAVAVQMGATKEDFDRTVALHPSTAEELVLMRTPEPEE